MKEDNNFVKGLFRHYLIDKIIESESFFATVRVN